MKNEAQTLKNIQDVFFGNYHMKFNSTANFMKRSIGTACDWGKGRTIELTDNFDIFLAQNKGNGPPGRQRSPNAPVTDNDPFINRIFAEPFGGDSTTNGPEFLKQEKQNDFDKNYNKFTIHFLNFTLMKKQIFILILAVFASVTVALGQAQHLSNPNTTSCSTDALHPAPGVPYGYKITATPSGGQYTWWATKDLNFISSTTSPTANNSSTKLTVASGDLIATSGNYGTPNSAAGADIVTITWSSAILANTKIDTNPTFVVGYYEANGAAGLCADNIKVYQLDPKNSFIVDIKSMDEVTKTPNGYGVNTETQCVDNVRTAKWVTNQVEYNYGVNYLYYEVVAANFSQEWKPQFLLTGQDATQSVTIEYTTDLPSTWSGSTAWVAGTTTVTTNATDTSNGVSIFVRVTVQNNNYQTLSDQQFTLAVAGTNMSGQWDVDNTTCTTPTDFTTASADDQVISTILKRPTLPAGTTSTINPNITLAPTNAVPNP